LGLGRQSGTFLTLDAGEGVALVDGGGHMHGDVHVLVTPIKRWAQKSHWMRPSTPLNQDPI
jgi:hypothetical protein